MLLAIFLTGAILWNLPLSKYDFFIHASQVEPGYLDFDNLPDTNFSCEGKVIGGYYADIETGCQMFHVCTIGQKSEITDIKFLCLNGTVFDQETRVCERLDEVDCSKSESFFDLNLELYGNNGGGYGIQSEDENKDSIGDQNCEEDYEDDGACKVKSEKDDKPKDEEYSEWEELTTLPAPLSRISSTTPSTTTAKPIISTTRASSNTHQKFNLQSLKDVPSPSTTQNPSFQILALHESFQENLKNHDTQKLRPSSSITTNRMPPPPVVSTYQLQNPVQVKPSAFSPLPNKLPNTILNLSQKSHFPTPLINNANRTPSPPQSVTYKSEPQQSNFYAKQHSQKVTSKPTLSIYPPLKHSTAEPSIVYRYNIMNTNSAPRSNPFSSSMHYNGVSNPPTTPSQTFKMEPVHVNPLSHPTFTVAQTRPYPFDPKTQQFITSKESIEPEEFDEGVEEVEELEEETAIPSQQPQLQPKFDHFNPHTNFARAISDLKNGSNAAVSVVQLTSSVSSSISSKPNSAIFNSSIPTSSSTVGKSGMVSTNKNGANSFASTLLDTSTRLNINQSNLTDINEQLSEDQPLYEEEGADYEESSQEYKDILYPTDVQKIKQR